MSDEIRVVFPRYILQSTHNQLTVAKLTNPEHVGNNFQLIRLSDLYDNDMMSHNRDVTWYWASMWGPLTTSYFQWKVVVFNLEISPFVGLLINLSWTSSDVCPGFWSQWIRCLSGASPACNGFLRFTSGATPADLMMASMVAEPFMIHILGKSWIRSTIEFRQC